MAVAGWAAVAGAALRDDTHLGQTYVLTGPEALSYGQVAQRMTTSLGREVNYVPLADDAYQGALVSAGLPPWYAKGLSELFQFYRAGKGAEVTDVVTRITGRAARTLDAYLTENRARFE